MGMTVWAIHTCYLEAEAGGLRDQSQARTHSKTLSQGYIRGYSWVVEPLPRIPCEGVGYGSATGLFPSTLSSLGSIPRLGKQQQGVWLTPRAHGC